MEDTANQEKNQYEHLRPWQFKPGQSGNPTGRPKGVKSLKQFAKEYLQSLSDEEKLEFLKGMDKIDIFKMAEGNPKQDTDLTSNGKTINIVVPEAVKETFNINEHTQETGGGH